MTCPLGAPAPAQSAGAYLLKQDEHNSADPDATVRRAGNVLHRSIKGQVPRFFSGSRYSRGWSGEICGGLRRGLEGVVSKRRDAPYRSGECRNWRKLKTAAWRPAAFVRSRVSSRVRESSFRSLPDGKLRG